MNTTSPFSDASEEKAFRETQTQVYLQRGQDATARGALDEAELAYAEALRYSPNSHQAHYALAGLRFPGTHYTDLLGEIHGALKPKTYLEIGVAHGASLTRARPPTRCVGIDPAPAIQHPITAPGRMFAIESDTFFAKVNVREALGGDPIALAFIDGLHLFEQVLQDFINVEAHCTPDSTILMHDCLPLNEVTAARERETTFWTGDTWRIIPILHQFRPDLRITLVRSPPSGLTIVRGLDPTSRVLRDNKQAAIDFGRAAPFPADEFGDLPRVKRIPSTWPEVAAVLQ